MASCNEFRIEADFRTLTELDAEVQRFGFDEQHARLRDQVAVHTIEGSQDIKTFQMILGKGVRGALPDNFEGVGAKYVQTMAIQNGHLGDFMAALDELAAFHQKLRVSPTTVWALRS